MINHKFNYSKSQILTVKQVHRNLDQDVIEITEDKLRIILNDNQKKLVEKSGFHAPLAIVITILLVLVTADFKATFGLSADAIHAVFVVCLFLAIGWLGKSLWSLRHAISVDNLLDIIKNKQDV